MVRKRLPFGIVHITMFVILHCAPIIVGTLNPFCGWRAFFVDFKSYKDREAVSKARLLSIFRQAQNDNNLTIKISH